MKYTREIAHIRQLCCLGLGGEAIIPALFKSLQKLVPSTTQTFFWLNNQGDIQKGYQYPFSPELTKIYFSEFYGKRELEAWPGIKKLAVLPTHDVGTCISVPGVDRAHFYRSDFYNLYLRPRESHDPVYIRIYENRCIVGIAMISRGAKELPFSQSELDLLNQLRPYISHALRPCEISEINYTDSSESGLIIVSPDNKIAFASPHAKALLYYASFPHTERKTGNVFDTIRIPVILQQIVKNLRETFNGVKAPPPVLNYQNEWGKFIFQAHYLEQFGADIIDDSRYWNQLKNNMIGVTIQYQEPVAIKLMRNMQELNLSPRQKEICLFVAEGFSYSEIAQRLGIRVTTIKTIVESVYVKLGVSGHDALINKLMVN